MAESNKQVIPLAPGIFYRDEDGQDKPVVAMVYDVALNKENEYQLLYLTKDKGIKRLGGGPNSAEWNNLDFKGPYEKPDESKGSGAGTIPGIQ